MHFQFKPIRRGELKISTLTESSDASTHFVIGVSFFYLWIVTSKSDGSLVRMVVSEVAASTRKRNVSIPHSLRQSFLSRASVDPSLIAHASIWYLAIYLMWANVSLALRSCQRQDLVAKSWTLVTASVLLSFLGHQRFIDFNCFFDHIKHSVLLEKREDGKY